MSTYTNILNNMAKAPFRNAAQPAFMVTLNTSISNATGDGTLYNILFDTIILDSSNSVTLNSGGSTRFTVPVSGNYVLATQVGVNNMVNAHNSFYSQIELHGTSGQYNNHCNPYVCQDLFFRICTLSAWIVVPLTAGNYVIAQAYVATGTKTISIAGTDTSSNGRPSTWFAGYLIG